MDDDERRRRSHATVDRMLERILVHDTAGFVGLFASDAVMEFPFTGPGAPQRLEGRDAVAAYMDGYETIVDVEEITAQTRHDTGDPDTLVLEFAAAGRVVATGAPYTLRYIAVLTVGEAGITGYRDYWNPLAVQEIFGTAGLAGAR